MTFAAVISDFDGVLADSTAAIRRAWARWGDRLGIDGAAIQEANHGRPGHAVVAEHVAADRVDAEAAWLLDAEIADTGGVVAYPGAAELLALPVVAIATSCAMPLARARLAAAGLVAPPVLVTVRPGRARQAGARPLPARRRAPRRRPRGVPRRRGRAGRDRRRPRGRDDRVGGHDDPRAGGAARGAPDRVRPARAARRPQAAARRLSSAGIAAQPSRAGGGIVGAPGSSAAARDASTVSGHVAARSSGMSFEPSPTASTASGERSRSPRSTRARPPTSTRPGAMTVRPQSGHTGSGARSWPKPAASSAVATGRRSASGRPSTLNANTGCVGDRRGGVAGARDAGERRGVVGMRGRVRREHDVDVALEDVDARPQPVRRERRERALAPPRRENGTAWKRVPSACDADRAVEPDDRQRAARCRRAAPRAARGRRAVAASTAWPSACSSSTAARVAGLATQSRPQSVPSRSVTTSVTRRAARPGTRRSRS